MRDWLISVLQDNPINGITFIMIGVLIIIIIQNSFLYFNYKDRSYLWYALYALFILFDQSILLHNSYIYTKTGKELTNLVSMQYALEWLYNSAYVIFIIEFGELYLIEKKVISRIEKLVGVFFFLLLILFGFDLYLDMSLVKESFLFILLPSLVGISALFYKYLYKVESEIKQYIYIGSFIFIFCIGVTLQFVFTNRE